MAAEPDLTADVGGNGILRGYDNNDSGYPGGGPARTTAVRTRLWWSKSFSQLGQAAESRFCSSASGKCHRFDATDILDAIRTTPAQVSPEEVAAYEAIALRLSR